MKENELRIGNKVNYQTAEGDILPNTIDWQDLKWLSEGEKGFNLCHSPIPLTEEWLVRLGFEKSSDNNYYKGGKFTIYNRFGNFGLIGGSLSWKEFKHVHKLQNLYFALTGEELTQNP